ncbi:MAG: alpha/beta hydrolase [Clostridium perfringens]|nr:alpha/beta hydrolase [Clostridium perfringens]
MKITNEMIDEELRRSANKIEEMLKDLFENHVSIDDIISDINNSPNNENIKNVLSNLSDSSDKEKFIKNFYENHVMMNLIAKQYVVEGFQCIEKWIPRKKDGSKLKIYIYKPIEEKKNVPGVLWIHGGGYAMGAPKKRIPTFKNLIDESNCIIVAPDYRLSLEAPYPAALNDCYEALLWLKENAKELGVRDDQIMVGGESAGGGLTAALSLYSRDKGEVNIAFQMPLYPMIDDRMTSESARDNNAPVWNSSLNEWGWKLYLSDLYGKDVPPYAAASRATDYRNLPPTVTFVGDLEPFKDETITYVKNLREAGVPVAFEMYNGAYHCFDEVCPDAEISKKSMNFFMEAFKYAVNNYFAKQTKN